MLSSRELTFINCQNERKWISQNQSIIDYAVLYMKYKELSYETIEAINHIRINKRIILPCELFGFNRDKVTKEAYEINATSSILWKVTFDVVLKPYKRLVETWIEFMG